MLDIQDSIRFVVIYNSLHPEDREIFDAKYAPGDAVIHYLGDIDLPDKSNLVAAINGKIVDPYKVCPRPGDIVSVTVEFEAGAIATAVVDSTLTAAIASGAIMTAVAWSAIYVAVTLAVGWGMSKLASMLNNAEKPDMGSIGNDTATSPTYGWGLLHQTTIEGNPIPILFGTHRIAGQVINKYTEVQDDNKEYYNALLAINDGQIDDIKDIKVNDQPAGYYRGIKTYKRLGALNDKPISDFNDIVTYRDLTVRLSFDWSTQETDGNQVEAIKIVFVCPNGLYYSNDKGGLDSRSVTLKIQYRAKGESTWTKYNDYRISGGTTSAIRRSVTIDNLDPNQYEVRISRTEKESNLFKECTKVYWNTLKEIIHEDLIYPGIAKYGIKVFATDQLSNSEPRLSAMASRNTISAYNPNTSTWEAKSASNPAWMCYSILNEYSQINHNRIIYNEFEEWAAYCAEPVDGEPRFTAGIYIDTVSNSWETLDRIANIARGRIIRKGAKYGVFVDKPETTVSHLFTVGNIIEDTFNLMYLPRKDRANAVEVTYVDPDQDYTNQVTAVYSDAYVDSTTSPKKTSIKVNAAIPRAQAVRQAAFLLNSNKYLARVIEFEASVDSFTAQLGDLVYFQHFIPRYDENLSGRIIDAGNDDGSGNPYVQIDQEITLKAETNYGILVRLDDDSLVEKALQIQSTTTTTNTLLLQSDWIEAPQQYDLYVFGPADTYKKPYRVTNITRAQDLTRRITLIEYVEEIYNDTNYVIETPTWDDAVVQEATQVSTEEFLTVSKSGDYQSNINVSWNTSREDVGSNWDVYLIDETLSNIWADGKFDESFQDVKNHPGIWHVGRTADMSFIIGPEHLIQEHDYTVVVCPAGQGLTTTGVSY